MFEPHGVDVTLTGRHALALAFRAQRPELQKKGPRARWRPQMIREQGLRLLRTTLLGYMPGWCPSVEAVGPFRPIRLEPASGLTVAAERLTTDHDGRHGTLASCSMSRTPPDRCSFAAPAAAPC
ncbi:hypothetical protein A6302_04484 [Methylobrevis pamukkalensis]|uniref:Uncharacterized protein n=2 Tax=Methylobrevis pamukkalensis TaxID=1439726 RepID=A0A1E3GR67_9HYPH|nr:hypothetical protein A6302_04484 [Methylobrevis pamukkalensis]